MRFGIVSVSRLKYLYYEGRTYFPFVVAETTKEEKLTSGIYLVKFLRFSKENIPIVSVVKRLSYYPIDILEVAISISELNIKTQREVIPILNIVLGSDYDRIVNILNILAIHDHGIQLIEKEVKDDPLLNEIGVSFEHVIQKLEEIKTKKEKEKKNKRKKKGGSYEENKNI